jgi:crotonobetaine/carnitine-CoA ligase
MLRGAPARRGGGCKTPAVLDDRFLAPHALAHWAAIQPDTVALDHLVGEHRLTYAELLDATRRWAGAYRRLGVGEGDRVATLLPNDFDAFVAWLGLGWLRAVEVPLNNAFTGRMLQYTLALADATMLVTTAELAERIVPIAAELPLLHTVVVVDDDEPSVSLPMVVLGRRAFLHDVEPALDAPGPRGRDIAAIIYTSGTTGPSKGVLVPWANFYQMWSWVPPEAVAPGEGIYTAFPLFHTSGKSVLNGALVRGARLAVRDKFSATSFLDDVRRGGCTLACIVGPMTAILFAQPERPDDADNPLRHIVLGPKIPENDAFERRFGVRTGTCYGMTETGAAVATGFEGGPWASCGRQRDDYPYTEVRIVDEHDEPVPVGEVGELIVRSRESWSLNAGYIKMPDKTAEAWRNGWFHTGDAFRVDEDGWYYFVDRMKDTIRRRGENISSFEVENFVIEHPEVVDCSAIGVPAQYGEDEVMIFITVQDPSTFAPAGLVAWLSERMPRFMVPRYVEVLDELPRVETSMRVKKLELRARGVGPATWDREGAAGTGDREAAGDSRG